jgi:hypothetical protein
MSQDNPDLVIVEEHVTAIGWLEDDPRPVSVNVIIDDDTGQGTFHMESDAMTGGVPIVQNYVVEFNNYQNGTYSNGFLVNFHLPADKGQNAKWTFDPSGPIWAKLVDKYGACPRNKNDNDPTLLTDPTLSGDNRTLTVGNANSISQYFGFALRFASTAAGKTLTYDPIGNNMNGSQRV